MNQSVESIRVIQAVEMAEGAGATVMRVFPTSRLRHVDPFVLLDEFTVKPPAAFPEHPHGGFEAITYMLDGAFRHKDDLGNDQIVSAGGVQRFTAGRRLVHAELPGSEETSHGLQLWVNLPRELKESDPSYQPVPASKISEQEIRGARIRTVVGEGSPVELQTDVTYVDVTLRAGSSFEHDIPAGWSGILYVLHGDVALEDSDVTRGQAAILGGGAISLKVERAARVVIICGKPHREPIRLRGSFVA